MGAESNPMVDAKKRASNMGHPAMVDKEVTARGDVGGDDVCD